MHSSQIMTGVCGGISLLVLASCTEDDVPQIAAGPPRGSEDVSINEPNGDKQEDGEAAATLIKVKDTALKFDPGTCLRGQAGFGWGLGSVRVNVLGRDAGFCIFYFIKEVEGWCRVYRCRVPAGGPPLKIFVENGGIETSFSLKRAKVIHSGKACCYAPGDATAPSFKSQAVADTHYVNYVADIGVGTGTVADQDSRVTIRYTMYADRLFDTELVGIDTNRTLEFALGGREVGAGMETAVQGMKVGGKRRVLIREEVAPLMSKKVGGVQPHTQLAIEIELVKVE